MSIEEEKNTDTQPGMEPRSVNGVVYDKETDDSCLGKYRMKPDTRQSRRQYFIDYYLKWVIAFVLGAAALFYVLKVTIYDYRETAVSVMFVEDTEITVSDLEEKLDDYLDLTDTKSESQVTRMGREMALTGTVLITRVAAGDVDVLIAEQDVFAHYLELGMFEDLDTFLADDRKELYRENAFTGKILETDSHGKLISTGEELWYGIRLKQLQGTNIAEMIRYMEEPVLGLVVNSKEAEIKTDTLDYLLKKTE
ncbi:MAG: hypothetical protein HUJ72_04465 [Blautia sp.]|nr:hypothetical protein [Blautia sp.]